MLEQTDQYFGEFIINIFFLFCKPSQEVLDFHFSREMLYPNNLSKWTGIYTIGRNNHMDDALCKVPDYSEISL